MFSPVVPLAPSPQPFCTGGADETPDGGETSEPAGQLFALGGGGELQPAGAHAQPINRQ